MAKIIEANGDREIIGQSCLLVLGSGQSFQPHLMEG
jgi:hypothetical protein